MHAPQPRAATTNRTIFKQSVCNPRGMMKDSVGTSQPEEEEEFANHEYVGVHGVRSRWFLRLQLRMAFRHSGQLFLISLLDNGETHFRMQPSPNM